MRTGLRLACLAVLGAVAVTSAVALSAEAAPPAPRPSIAQSPFVPPSFVDDFNGAAGSPADPAKWANQVGGQWNDGVDQQYYTPGSRNASLSGHGTLVINARQERFAAWDADRAYTSARLVSRTSVKYGHVDARMRFSGDLGAFPAIWLLGDNYPQVGWPGCGELDLMETRGLGGHISYGIHGPQTSGQSTRAYYWAGGQFETPSTDWIGQWHEYGMDWTPSQVSWSVDGRTYATVSRDHLGAGRTWSVDQSSNLVLNVAVGGYGGTPAQNFSATMEIDWIRVTPLQ